jgi:hypothetical protein
MITLKDSCGRTMNERECYLAKRRDWAKKSLASELWPVCGPFPVICSTFRCCHP